MQSEGGGYYDLHPEGFYLHLDYLSALGGKGVKMKFPE